jgi:hypothetical protein
VIGLWRWVCFLVLPAGLACGLQSGKQALSPTSMIRKQAQMIKV